jgi:3-isopropylmalate/(R)-2-methylmalate dehydratase small subunit
LLTVVLAEDVVDALQRRSEADPAAEVTVDLQAREVHAGDLRVGFEIDDYTRWRLLEGLDDIALTLTRADSIAAFEAARPRWLPVTTG